MVKYLLAITVGSFQFMINDFTKIPQKLSQISYKSASHLSMLLIFVFLSVFAQADDWSTEESEHFIIHFADNRGQARMILQMGESFYADVTKRLGSIEGKIEIWIFSQKQFRVAAGAPIQDWAVGAAYARLRRILLREPSFIEERKLELGRVLRHEIVHVIFGYQLRDNIEAVPLWFHEGIAMYESYEWTYGRDWILLGNVLRNSIIPLDQLTTRFPQEANRAQLAYAESFNAVSFIVREHGYEKLRMIIDLLASGESMDRAFKLAINANLTKFQWRWMQYLERHYQWSSILSSSVLLWGTISFIVVWAYIRRRKSRRKQLARWEEEEQKIDEFFR